MADRAVDMVLCSARMGGNAMSIRNQFVLRIDTSNSDFDGQDTDAIKAIFDQVYRRMNRGDAAGTVRDRNGNTVGEYVWEYTPPGHVS